MDLRSGGCPIECVFGKGVYFFRKGTYFPVFIGQLRKCLQEDIYELYDGMYAFPQDTGHCDFLTVGKVPVRSDYIRMKFILG